MLASQDQLKVLSRLMFYPIPKIHINCKHVFVNLEYHTRAGDEASNLYRVCEKCGLREKR